MAYRLGDVRYAVKDVFNGYELDRKDLKTPDGRVIPTGAVPDAKNMFSEYAFGCVAETIAEDLKRNGENVPVKDVTEKLRDSAAERLKADLREKEGIRSRVAAVLFFALIGSFLLYFFSGNLTGLVVWDGMHENVGSKVLISLLVVLGVFVVSLKLVRKE